MSLTLEQSKGAGTLTKLGHRRVAVGVGATVLDEGREPGLTGSILQLNLELVLHAVRC